MRYRDPMSIRPHGLPGLEVYRGQEQNDFLHLNIKTKMQMVDRKSQSYYYESRQSNITELIFSVVCLDNFLFYLFLKGNRKLLFFPKYRFTRKLNEKIRKWQNLEILDSLHLTPFIHVLHILVFTTLSFYLMRSISLLEILEGGTVEETAVCRKKGQTYQ